MTQITIGMNGVNVDTVEQFNAAVQNMVRKVHGTKNVEAVTHITHGMCGLMQFNPSKQMVVVVDMSQMNAEEQTRVAKIVKSCNRNTPTTMVNAE